MKSVQELIAIYRRHEADCLSEKLEVIDQYNLGGFNDLTEADVRNMIATWEEERVVARDTTAWLETLAARLQPAPDCQPGPGDAAP